MSECNHDCGSCSADCGSRKADKNDFREALAPEKLGEEGNRHLSAGKGGVGKSLVTSMLACEHEPEGETETAILDADITGPSILHGIRSCP